MNSARNKKPYKKFALALSLFLLVVWGILGTGASLAWFVDVSDEVTNIFHAADFDLIVRHRVDVDDWRVVDANTPVFNNQALYEPGYVQIVYLEVENAGDVPFDFHTAVSVIGSSVATNKFGQQFWLHEYLRFGVALADSEAEMDEAVSTRAKAVALSTMKLQNYSTEVASLDPGAKAYLAIIVRMPEEVGNEANHIEGTPQVELGVIVKADQQNMTSR